MTYFTLNCVMPVHSLTLSKAMTLLYTAWCISCDNVMKQISFQPNNWSVFNVLVYAFVMLLCCAMYPGFFLTNLVFFAYLNLYGVSL